MGISEILKAIEAADGSIDTLSKINWTQFYEEVKDLDQEEKKEVFLKLGELAIKWLGRLLEYKTILKLIFKLLK